uniref:Uncharacterized protein n=1 Tax=Medicago truncatula TaxID=3880 RepID=Q2HU89_MEDTR|nr:hypothetical protein MtrDRAFT_AC149208g41v2 [Medicago truncatula]
MSCTEVGEQRPPLEEFNDGYYEGKGITPRASLEMTLTFEPDDNPDLPRRDDFPSGNTI